MGEVDPIEARWVLLERILTKHCRGCNRFKLLGDFERDRVQWDGHARFCKTCRDTMRRMG